MIRNLVLAYFDYIFTCIFAIEMFLKILDLGVILHPGSYCRFAFNAVTVVAINIDIIMVPIFAIQIIVVVNVLSLCRDFWNIMDAIVVCCALLAWMFA